MTIESLAFPAAVWLAVTSLALLLSHNWRWSISFLAIQYVGVFVMVAQSWPIEIAVTKLVAGWMASAVLGVAISEARVSMLGDWAELEAAWPASRIFRLLAASLVGLAVFSVSGELQSWLPGASLEQAVGGLTVIGLALLQLGFTAQPLRVVIGLLTLLAGFEIFYAAVETSALVAGLMAGVNLGLALIGAYLLLAPTMETE